MNSINYQKEKSNYYPHMKNMYYLNMFNIKMDMNNKLNYYQDMLLKGTHKYILHCIQKEKVGINYNNLFHINTFQLYNLNSEKL